MNLEFTSITIKEFGALDDVSVDFAELGHGVCFVQGKNKVEPRLGSNGAGKSSIFNAMSWCLFGRTIAGLRGTDVKPWDVRGATPTVIVCINRNGKPHKIKRSTASNGLWIDGKVVDQQSIDRLVGMTYVTFPHTLVLGQGQELFFDLSAKGKMDVLSETLELDKWEDRSKAAKELANSIDAKASTLTTQISERETVLDRAQKALDDLKVKSTAWEEERAARDKTRDKEIAAYEEHLDTAEKEWGTLDLAYDGAETELRAAQREFDKAQVYLGTCSIRAGELNAAHQNEKDKLRDLTNELADLVTGDKCPTCGQSLKGTSLAKHRADIKKSITNREKQVEAAKSTAKASDKTKAAAQDRVDMFAKQVRDFREKSNDVVDKRANAEKRVIENKAALTLLKKQSKTEEDTANPFSELIATQRASIKKLKGQIGDLEIERDRAHRAYDRTQYWVKGFKHVRLYLLQEILDELQGVTAELLPSIGLDGWTVEYAMERENKQGNISTGLNVTIHKPNGKQAVKWESWSGGEGQRLRLIGAIALSETLLRRAGVACDFMVLDEPTRHLSPEGVRETCDFLIERGRGHQIFYVDHQAIESARFRHVMTVTRTRKGTRIDVQ